MKKLPKGAAVVDELVLSEPQVLALIAGAGNHGFVIQARGFGRDKNIAHAIDGKVYRQLVGLELLTPYPSRAPFTGEALSSYGGKDGFLTSKGQAVAVRLVTGEAEKSTAKYLCGAFATAMHVDSDRLEVSVRYEGGTTGEVTVRLNKALVFGERAEHVRRLLAALPEPFTKLQLVRDSA